VSSTYRELPPPPQLHATVACLWVREVDRAGTQLVVPDACIDLVALPRGLVVAGPDTGPSYSTLAPGDTVVGLRFRPGAAPPVLGWPARELRDRRTPLADLWGREGERLAEDALGHGGPVRASAVLEAVRRRLSDAPAPDPVVRAAIHELARGRAVGALPETLFLSERQLRRRFHDAVGYGPKVLARVLRFQRMLALAPQSPGNLARLAAEAGYADHAHMAAETAALAGLPPSALIEDRFPQAETALAA
jgi:AraC-like DNA-binding protein